MVTFFFCGSGYLTVSNTHFLRGIFSLAFDRWALYPPGKVPLGVTVHVNEDDGDVNIETPSSLQVL